MSAPPRLQVPKGPSSTIKEDLIISYHCRQSAHMPQECPMIECHFGQQGKTSNLLKREDTETFLVPTRIGPHQVGRLMDFGCGQMILCQDLLPSKALNPKWMVQISCICGERCTYLTASIIFQVADQVGNLRVGLVEPLPWSEILGHDWSTSPCS